MGKVLTISIAAYNIQDYIRQTLQSCIIDDMDSLEVIVVDDGSADDTAKLAEEFVAQYPDTFKVISKENGGYGSTINTSLPIARGKYYKLLDGDDWFDSENLSSYVQMLKGVDADLSLTRMTEVFIATGELNVIDKAPDNPVGVYPLDQLSFTGLLAMHTIAYRTDLLRSINLSITQNCFYTDIEYLQIPLPFVQTVHVWHESVYQYRIGRGEQSMSLSGVRKHYKDHEKMLKRMLSIRDGYKADGVRLPVDFENRMTREVRRHYKFLLVLENGQERLAELRAFDDYMQRHTDLLARAEKSNRKVWLARRTKFVFHELLSRYIAREAVRV